MCKSRFARTVAIASLGLAVVCCGRTSSLPAVGDGSVKNDAAVARDAPTRTDATVAMPEAGPLDGRQPTDAGQLDAREPGDGAPADAGVDLCANKSCGQNE